MCSKTKLFRFDKPLTVCEYRFFMEKNVIERYLTHEKNWFWQYFAPMKKHEFFYAQILTESSKYLYLRKTWFWAFFAPKHKNTFFKSSNFVDFQMMKKFFDTSAFTWTRRSLVTFKVSKLGFLKNSNQTQENKNKDVTWKQLFKIVASRVLLI